MLIVKPQQWQMPTQAGTPVFDWVKSTDGIRAANHGCHQATLMPTDAEVVLVLPAQAVSWHRLTLPKIAPSRLRQALEGALEDQLLDEPQNLHFATEPNAQAGQPTWVATCHLATLQQWLAHLEQAHRPVARIAIEASPSPSPQCQALMWQGQAWWVVSTPEGVLPIALEPSLDKPPAWLAALQPALMRCSSEPHCIGQTELLLAQSVNLQTTADRLLACAQSPWNLAQFQLKLSAQARRQQALLKGLRACIYAPEWRAARWAGVALLGTSLLGLNLQAWAAQHQIKQQQQQIRQLLQNTFPNVSMVMNAPLQMQNELASLQKSNGQLSAGDVEHVLMHIGQVLQETSLQMTQIEYSPNRIDINLNEPASPEWMQRLNAALLVNGWQADTQDQRLLVRRRIDG